MCGAEDGRKLGKPMANGLATSLATSPDWFHFAAALGSHLVTRGNQL